MAVAEYLRGLGVFGGLGLFNGVQLRSVTADPTNGSSGTFAAVAGPGSMVISKASGTIFINKGTLASPTWVPANGVAHAHYDFAVDGGAIGAIVPAKTAVIPANGIVTGPLVIFSPTAVTSAGSATIAIGTDAGSSASSLLTATAKTSFSLNGVTAGAIDPSTAAQFVRLSADGKIQLTVAVAVLTAGVIDIYVPYVF